MTNLDPRSIEWVIRKHCLANAVKYGGKANAKAVIGKLLAERPDLRAQARELSELVRQIVEQVNALSLDEQRSHLREMAPELLEQRRERKEKELPPLEGAEMGRVVTRLPPEPSGYPHIGHAYAGYINWYYARKYKGRIVLRFEDTNPRNVRREYYDAFREGYRWMGIDWDKELKVSDDIPYFYDRGRDLLERGQAYMCNCPADLIKRRRRTGEPCPHRDTPPEDNLAIWDAIFDGQYGEGEVVCRLKIDLNHPNAVMRDPNIFRIIEHPHPFQGDKYRLWPTYDFAVALEDHLNGVTHILRSNEFASRGELQAYIRSLFGMPQPCIQEFSRFTIEGTPVAKRLIRPLIKEGIITGWDDIRLATLTALRRRGIVPQTIKELTLEVGMSVAQPVIDWSLILGINRRIIDPIANRYYCVTNPILLTIDDAPPRQATIPLHPDFPERGSRAIPVEHHVYIDGEDAARLQPGQTFRLKHLYNVRLTQKNTEQLRGIYAGDQITPSASKIQWVTDDAVPVQMIIPSPLFIGDKLNPNSLHVKEGMGETALRHLTPGTIIQFERIGFGCIESVQDRIVVNMVE